VHRILPWLAQVHEFYMMKAAKSRFVVYYRPIFLITLLKAGGEKGYSLSVGFFFQEKGAPLPAQILAGQCRGRAP
jgi:hypothetical protein